jgi:hypothetical protein
MSILDIAVFSIRNGQLIDGSRFLGLVFEEFPMNFLLSKLMIALPV